METSVRIDMTGNLSRMAERNARAIGRMSKRGQRHLREFGRTAARQGKRINRLGNRYSGMVSGVAGAASAKMLMNLERRFTRLGIQANKDEKAMDGLKKKIYETALAPDIRIDPGQITSAIEAIVEKTGDLDFANDNLRNIGLAIQATGAQGGAIGELLGEFQKMGIKAPAEVLRALDTLNVQGKEGAFTLQNIAALGPRVITAYTSLGRTGVPALKEMGAALQLIRMGTGSSEMAATAFEATLRTLTDPKKMKMLEQVGVSLFDPQKLKEGKRVLQPINEIMTQIVELSGGDKTKLNLIFDAEAVRAFAQAAGEFQRTGKLDSLRKFMDMQGDGTTTLKDSARAAKDSVAAMQNLYTVWQKFADNKLTEPMHDMAEILNHLTDGNTDKAVAKAAKTEWLTGGDYGESLRTKIDDLVRFLDGEKNSLGQPNNLGSWFYKTLNPEVMPRSYIGDLIDLLSGKSNEVSGTIKLEIDGAARVKEIHSNNPNVSIDVESGATMNGL